MKKIFLLLFNLIIVLTIYGCSNNKTGSFKVIDGKEVYVIGKEQVLDKLVEVDGENYYIDETGLKIKNDWHQINNDGDYGYFGAMGQMIKNQIKDIDGYFYLFDEKGIMRKNGVKLFNENNYYAARDGHLLCNSIVEVGTTDFYFGDDGVKIEKSGWVYNEDGELPKGYYYLDSEGNRLKDSWQDDCYLDKQGLMATNKWVDGFYVGNDGKILKNQRTPDGKNVGTDGKVVQEVKTSQTYTQNANTTNNGNSSNEKIEELYVKNIEKIQDFYDYDWTSSGDNYDVNGCEISITKPIIAGVNEEEVQTINSQISNLMEQLVERLKDEDVLATSYHALSSIDINEHSIKYTDNKATITIKGKGKYTTDYSKNSTTYITFIIEYNRKDKVSKMNKEAWTGSDLNLNSSEIFYAE